MTDRYYAFPDIHGEALMLDMALQFVYNANPDGGKIIFLGDYIDRGPENKRVISTVMNPPAKWEFVCLLGNHEDMFLDALHGRGQFYDRDVVLEYVPDAKSLLDVHNGMPKDVIEWMKQLKLTHIEDNNVFAHAYYDASLRQEDQSKSEVIWTRMDDWMGFQSPGNKMFLTHGHTPRKHGPVTSPNRLNLDVGAVFYGQYAIAEFRKGVTGPVDLHKF